MQQPLDRVSRVGYQQTGYEMPHSWLLGRESGLGRPWADARGPLWRICYGVMGGAAVKVAVG